MKKLMVLFSIVVLSVAIGYAAVDTTKTATWKITWDKAGQNFIKNDHMTRSFDLNKTTNHLLVATRTGGHRIVVLDAATGDSLAQMDMTGVSGGTYHLNKVAVAEDGVIYACNLNTGNGFKIYRWQDETSLPTLAADYTVEGATRFGDAFAVRGQGVNTKIYITGNNAASKVVILGTQDGINFNIEKVIPNGRATDIFPVDADSYWLKFPGGVTTLYNTDGAKLKEIPTSIISTASCAIDQFAYFGHWYLGVFDGNQPSAMGRLVQLANSPETRVNAVFAGLGTNPNTNGVGDVYVDPDSNRIFLLATNNSISMFPLNSYAVWTLNWRSKADTAAWHGTNNEVRSVAYNPVTKHLIVASRRGGSFIKVFDPATGAFIKDLNNVGIGGGTYNINMVTCSADGQIFVGNLALSGVNYKLYRWGNEDAAPELVFDGLLEGRVGDALDCSGIGKNVEVYASGIDNTKIFIFAATETEAFVRNGEIPLPEKSAARYGISAVKGKDYFFISAPGKPVRYIKRDGTVLAELDPAEVSGVSARYFEVPTLRGVERKFLFIANGWTPGVQAVELFGQDGDNLCSYYEVVPARTAFYSNNANLNATAQCVYEVWNNQVIELSTNNGLSAYSFANIEPEAGILMAEPLFSTRGMDFGNVPLRSTQQKSFWVTNVGTAPWHIEAITTELPIFDVDVDTAVTLGVGDTLFVNVHCAPTAEGSFYDAVTFHSDAGFFEVDLSVSAYEMWPVIWRQIADKTDWFYKETNRDQVRTIAYNKKTNHLITVSRVGGTFVKALDPKTGEVVRDLDVTGISGGTYAVNMCAVTQDGQIFVGNLALAGVNFKLYRYANEAAAPVMVFDGVLEGRCGDALGVAGTGNAVTVYVSGSDNTKIFTIKTTDGTTFARGADIPLPEKSAARYAISPVDTNYLFIEGPGKMVRYLKTDGTVLKEFDREEVGGTSCTYFEVATTSGTTRRFIAACDGFNPGVMVVELLGAPGDDLCSSYQIMPAKTPMYDNKTNLNATAQATYCCLTNGLIELTTNNGITNYSFAYVVPDAETCSLCSPIAAVKIDADGDFVPDLKGQTVTICGIINSNNYSTTGTQFYMQDETAGINLYTGAFKADLKIGDVVQVTGRIDQYYGLTEIIPEKPEDLVVMGTTFQPVPLPIQATDLKENIEGMLVQVFRYWLVDPSKWPAAGKNATVQFTDGTHTIDVFIDKDVGISGSPAPTGFVNLIGVVDQYTSKVPPDNGYEIRPRMLSDIVLITSVENKESIPTQYALRQNYPNPFNPTTTITFETPEDTDVKIKVFDILGKEVLSVYEGKLKAGYHRFEINGASLPTGIYFYRVESDRFVDMKKMTLVK